MSPVPRFPRALLRAAAALSLVVASVAAAHSATAAPAALPRTGWTATASATYSNEPAANMLDGNLATRWSTGTAMTPGQFVTIDTGRQQNLGRITMDSGPSTGDYARGYQVYLSTNGTGWTNAVATGSGAGQLVDVTFAAQSTRYIKVVETGSAGNWWSIAEFNAYAGTTSTTSWIGGWGDAQAAGGNGVVNQTIRMVVHLTAPGTSVRVRLSNFYGVNPLPIGAANVAIQAGGANAASGTSHAVTFGGSRTATIPAGADLSSDPIAMNVTAEQNLLVSVYYSGNAGASGWHYDARDVTYYSTSGNFADDQSAANYPAADNSWYYVDGVDVQSAAATGTLVAFGDSITDGANSSLSTNSRWPNFLARRLEAQPGGPKLGVVNAGIGGNRVLTDTNSQFGSSALHRFQHDALGRPGIKGVILLEGINDIGTGIGPNGALTAQDLINGYQSLIQQAHSAGVKIYGATILPYQGAGYYSANGEQIREAVNNWIRTGGAYDAVFDLDAAMRSSSNQLALNPAYDGGDHLHPNDAGYQAMANAIDLTKLPS
jgi:lysophospholipase L1-like esterase